MIKLLFSGKQLLLFIILAWSILIYVGCNVLTVEASTTDKQAAQKEMCEDDYKAKWKDSECHFSKASEKFDDQGDYEHDLIIDGLYDDYAARQVAKAEEIAAKEDAICDDEDADTTNIKLCMSEDRLQQAAFNIDKDECKEANGDWKKDRCTYYEDEQEHEEVKPKLLVPSLLEGTLTKEQKEALSKENPDWEFKPGVNIPNSLEGTLTQKQSGAVSKDNYDIEYQWEDTDSNPVPGTPSYVDPDEVEEEPVPVIEDWSNTAVVSEDEEQERINAEIQQHDAKYGQLAKSSPTDYEVNEQEQEEETADYNEEVDNQVNTDTEDSSDNTDSSDSGDDSSSSDDGGDSGESSESEE